MIINLKEIALEYRKFGFQSTCITNKPNEYNKYHRNFFKTPNHSWDNLTDNIQTNSEFENLDWKNAVGIGTVTKWNKLSVIDIDGCSNEKFLHKVLRKLNLPIDYEWVVESGSKNGFHIYYYGKQIKECIEDSVVSTFPPKKKYEAYFDKIEFLWETHCVLPPSVHGSGNRYQFLNKKFPKFKPNKIDKNHIYDFIEEFLDFDELVHGENYGKLKHSIRSNGEFVNEIGSTDISKYLMDDIYIIVDIETSGLPYKKENQIFYPEILQISWLLTNSKGILIKKNSYIVKSNFFINNSPSNLNIDFEVAKIVGYPLVDIIKRFIEDLKISDFVVSHNIDFDIPILSNHFVKNYNINPFKNKRMLCTMKSSVDYCKIPSDYGYKYPKLSELFQTLFVCEAKNLHNAEIDILYTLKCFKKLKELKII